MYHFIVKKHKKIVKYICKSAENPEIQKNRLTVDGKTWYHYYKRFQWVCTGKMEARACFM